MTRLLSFVAAFFILVAAAAPALAEKRVALVIGNSSYVNIPRLANPVSDARLIADTLKELGFTLVGNGPQLDLDEPGLRRVVQAFGTQLQGADVGVFYFAGHGVQMRGANYLVPIGANPTKESDVDFQMLDTNLVLRQMEGAGTRLNVVILDACRNNPFGGRGLRSAGNGLAQVTAPEGTLISFATQPGNVALDGEGGNSPYTKALAQTLRRPGLGIFDAFNEVGLAVKHATGGSQQPWVSSSPIAGSFYFAGLPTAPGEPTVDTVFWSTIRDSEVAVLFEEFLKRFPASPHAAEARARLSKLKDDLAAVMIPSGQSKPTTPSVRTEDEALWIMIKDATATAGFEEFLRRFPGSPRAAQVSARLEELKRGQTSIVVPAGRPNVPITPAIGEDERLWIMIKDATATAGFEEFLRRFPTSPRAAQVRARLEELERRR